MVNPNPNVHNLFNHVKHCFFEMVASEVIEDEDRHQEAFTLTSNITLELCGGRTRLGTLAIVFLRSPLDLSLFGLKDFTFLNNRKPI